MWRLSKSAIPCSLATMVNGHFNPKLMRSIRICNGVGKAPKKCYGENRSHVAEAHGKLKEEKKSGTFSAQKSL